MALAGFWATPAAGEAVILSPEDILAKYDVDLGPDENDLGEMLLENELPL